MRISDWSSDVCSSDLLIGKSQRELSALRGKRIAMIFQDPMTSLNPVMTVGEQIVEAITIHDRAMPRQAKIERALDLLKLVSIPFPERRRQQYPRSEEHTSELQSLMRISYAVFRLKKKKI